MSFWRLFSAFWDGVALASGRPRRIKRRLAYRASRRLIKAVIK